MNLHLLVLLPLQCSLSFSLSVVQRFIGTTCILHEVGLINISTRINK